MSGTKKFVDLVAANPELPIVAMVNGDICHDYGMYWVGAFSAASIEFVGIVGERWYDDREEFIEVYYDKYADELCEKFNYDPQCCAINVDRGLYTQEQFAANCLADEKLSAYLEEKANEYMKKCILVYIDEPDMSGWKEA